MTAIKQLNCNYELVSPMADELSYTINELAAQAGVTPRTIRYYTSEGLLPPPDTRGRYALYSNDHLERLRLITRLKDAYLPLGEIKARVAQLTQVQVQQLLAEEEPSPPASSPAADYIAQVLARRPTAGAGPRAMISEARADLYQVDALQVEQAKVEGPAAPALGRAELLSPPAAPPPAPAPAQGSFVSRSRAAPQVQVPPAVLPSETWQRVPLGSRVELHIREPLTPELRERVEQLIALAHTILPPEQ